MHQFGVIFLVLILSASFFAGSREIWQDYKEYHLQRENNKLKKELGIVKKTLVERGLQLLESMDHARQANSALFPCVESKQTPQSEEDTVTESAKYQATLMEVSFVFLVLPISAFIIFTFTNSKNGYRTIQLQQENKQLKNELDESKKTLEKREVNLLETIDHAKETKNDVYSNKGIFFPAIAYRKALPPGATLSVCGTPLKHADFEEEIELDLELGDSFYVPFRFYINIMDKNGNVAFHFNPRFDQRRTAVNAYIDGWGEEENWHRGPFKENVKFNIEIKNTGRAFEIRVNGKTFGCFSHRVDHTELIGFQIGGDVEINSTSITMPFSL